MLNRASQRYVAIALVAVTFLFVAFFYIPGEVAWHDTITSVREQLSGLKSGTNSGSADVPSFNDGGAAQQKAKKSGNNAYVLLMLWNDDIDDGSNPLATQYVWNARTMLWALLYHPYVGTKAGYPVVMLLHKQVPKVVRDTLKREGATIIDVGDIKPTKSDPSTLSGNPRYWQQFAKLAISGLTQYDRVLYLDTDIVLTRCLDPIFEEPIAVQPAQTKQSLVNLTDEMQPPAEYLMASVPENGVRERPMRHFPNAFLQGGFMMMKPSREMHDYYMWYMDNKVSEWGPFGGFLMEMGMFSHIHRHDGPMPYLKFPKEKWHCNFVADYDYEHGCATLHDKYWWINGGVSDYMLVAGNRMRGQMEGYWLAKHNEPILSIDEVVFKPEEPGYEDLTQEEWDAFEKEKAGRHAFATRSPDTKTRRV